jgi:hypothetical protein
MRGFSISIKHTLPDPIYICSTYEVHILAVSCTLMLYLLCDFSISMKHRYPLPYLYVQYIWDTYSSRIMYTHVVSNVWLLYFNEVTHPEPYLYMQYIWDTYSSRILYSHVLCNLWLLYFNDVYPLWTPFIYAVHMRHIF